MELTTTNPSDYQLFAEATITLLNQLLLVFTNLTSIDLTNLNITDFNLTNTVYETSSGAITLAGHSAILAFYLITLHTAAVYAYLTSTMLTIQRRYHSKMDGYTQFQVFQTLIRKMVATRGLTLWLRKNGAADDTHLLHIKRPRNLSEYLLPKVEVLPRSKQDPDKLQKPRKTRPLDFY